MNKFITSDNGGLPIHLDDLRFIDDSVRNVLKGIMSAYGIAADESFILSGAGSTLNGGNFDIAAGYISLDGEILEVEAHSITTTLAPGEAHVWKLKTANDPAGLKTFESTASFDTYEVRQAEVEVETPVGVFMPMLADNLPAKISAFYGTILQTKVIDIGTWNMEVVPSVQVAHGLADAEKIRTIDVMILTDGVSQPDGAPTPLTTGSPPNGGIDPTSSSNINLFRLGGGLFDDGSFFSQAGNRGYITIQYEL